MITARERILKNVSKFFGPLRALSEVDLTIYPGEIPGARRRQRRRQVDARLCGRDRIRLGDRAHDKRPATAGYAARRPVRLIDWAEPK
jgi:hypothetical protein